MKIESVRIKNLRSFADVTVPFNDYTCLVGPNGSGKSTILCALNVFFRQTENAATNLSQLDREDFHHKNTADPIEITVTFTDLGQDAEEDFRDYCRQGKLIVSAIATFNESAGKAEVKQRGERLVLPAFKEFFRAVGDGESVSGLRQLYSNIRQTISELPSAPTRDAMISALRKYESEHTDQMELIPSEDQFYGISKGANRLRKYIQWVFVPAVKDATTEQLEERNTALGKLLARTVRNKINFEEQIRALREETQEKYKTLLENHQAALENVSSSLNTRLAQWAHPGVTLKLEWHQDPEKSVRVEEPLARIIAGESDFEGELGRFGHGLQRSYLLALLQELAGADDPSAPRLILGCEEPELYQHPPQARHLAAVFQKLTERNSQVIVSTHSPLFVSGAGFENVRMVRKDSANKCSEVKHMTFAEIANEIATATGKRHSEPSGIRAKINQSLQPYLNEMFFATRLILVEGVEDVAYITAYLNLLGKWDEYRQTGCHIVPVNGKSQLLQPLVIAKGLRIPTFIVFDADSDEQDAERRKCHANDNRALLALVGMAAEDPMPTKPLWGTGFVMWHSNIGSIVRDDIGTADWSTFEAEADKQFGHAGNLKKNGLHIGAALAEAWNAGKTSFSLGRLCGEILNPGSSVQ